MIEKSTQILFTRYLYVKIQVKQSLLLALFDRDWKQALFWGYELYYSGFQEETMEFLQSIYKELYLNQCSRSFHAFFIKQYDLWKRDITNEHVVGILIRNLVLQEYNIDNFYKSYFHISYFTNTDTNTNTNTNTNTRMRITGVNIDKYKNKNLNMNPRFVMKNECLYKVNTLLSNISSEDLKESFYYHWEYYAFDCPLWNKRFLEHKAYKNDEKKRIEFATVEDEENFVNLYYYEPDEQSKEIQEKCIGTPSEKQISIKELTKKYGGTVVYRKLQNRISNRSSSGE
jgi:hypothetical protein